MDKKILVKNTKALFDYEIIQKFEAGIVLEDWEPKPIRKGLMQIQDTFCKVIKGEVFLMNSHIGRIVKNVERFPVLKAAAESQQRPKKLLLHKKEILKIAKMVDKEGLTIVPLLVYLNEKNKIKIEIGVAKGKKSYDKRQDKKEKDIDRYEKKQAKGDGY